MNLTQTRYILEMYKRIATGITVDIDDVDMELIKATLERDRLVVSGIDTCEIDEYISELENILYHDNQPVRN